MILDGTVTYTIKEQSGSYSQYTLNIEAMMLVSNSILTLRNTRNTRKQLHGILNAKTSLLKTYFGKTYMDGYIHKKSNILWGIVILAHF